MPVVDVLNLEGAKVGEIALADAVFAAQVNPHLLHATVRWYLASQRAGTHKTKGRGEVQGSGRKLWRQKGTGRARIGSIRSPLWRKGGTVHGPQPRSYRYRLPRKVFLGALRSALSAKLAAAKLTVVEGWELPSHKTQAFRAVLDKLDGQSRTLLLVGQSNRNLELASRNLEGVKLVDSRALEPYDLLRHDRLLLSKHAAEKLSAALAPTEQPARAEAEVQTAAKVAPRGHSARARKSAAPRAPRAKSAKPAAAAKPKAKPRSTAKPRGAAGRKPKSPSGQGKE
jgi:large subunit ribosomal protein L4